MRQQKYTAIREYLSAKFPGSTIEEKNDSTRHAFKIHIAGGSRLLKVAEEFADDNNVTEIRRQFDLWDVAGVLARESEQGVMVTQEGLRLFPRG